MSHHLKMFIACVVPLLLIFLLPAMGATGDGTFFFLLLAVFAAHLIMMRTMPKGGNNRRKKTLENRDREKK